MHERSDPTRRLCIYVTFSKDRKVKEYVNYMLDALKKCCTKLCAVCNYPELQGEELLHLHADEVFYRENRGYDAGAYKDILCTLLGCDTVYEYDELILVNDSFFGPFFDLNNYFKLMNKEECDFWGMTRHPSGEIYSIGYSFESHIQSYFLVFRSQVFKNNLFREFWEKFSYPNTFMETIINFELGLNQYLKINGFISKALTDVWGIKLKKNENPTIYYPHELIRDNGLPIMKKKILLISSCRFINAINTINFLKKNNLYPVEWIWDGIDSQFYIEGYASNKNNCLNAFRQRYKKIYLYGAGICGKNLNLYFKHRGWNLDGIVVSDVNGQTIDCIPFTDADIDDETGIIVSVIDRKASEEILKYIGSKCSREQLFLISDCAAIVPKNF